MQVVFRTDANALIGTGHLMRCLALAGQIHDQGGTCSFLCRKDGFGEIEERILKAGHQLLTWGDNTKNTSKSDTERNGCDWLPGGWEMDVRKCLDSLRKLRRPDWIVIDHYGIDARWEMAMRRSTRKLMAVDDVANRPHECDFLLDQNLVRGMQHRYDALVATRTRTLLGPQYALLRPEFASIDRQRGKMAQPPRLLVMFGGSDQHDLTARIMRVISGLQWSGAVDVVVGPYYANLKNLRKSMKNLIRGKIHAPAWNIAELMCQADLALGSPGVTSWERCACALPALTIAQAANQVAIGLGLNDAGAHCYLGTVDSVSDIEIAAALSRMASDTQELEKMSRSAGSITDGAGSLRVSRLMMESL